MTLGEMRIMVAERSNGTPALESSGAQHDARARVTTCFALLTGKGSCRPFPYRHQAAVQHGSRSALSCSRWLRR